MDIEALPNPGVSIYLWMFRQGLKHIPGDVIVHMISKSEHKIRRKDKANYGRGYYKSDLYNGGTHSMSLLKPPQEKVIKPFYTTKYSAYNKHPFINLPEIENRYVPCNADGIPLIKGSTGCYSLSDAKAFKDCVNIGENLKGTKFIVIDIDGDHGGMIHKTVIKTWQPYIFKTHAMIKPTTDNKLTSYHLTFAVDKVIPTMHFPNAHVDIIGNKMNSIRYFKNKQGNGIEPLVMTDNIGDDIINKIKVLEGSD